MSALPLSHAPTPGKDENMLAQRIFTMADQHLFAKLTGDVNPLHMDTVRARRTVVGNIAVHGMHTLLWALDCLTESPYCPGAITHLDVRFPKPLHPDEEVSLFITKTTSEAIHLKAIAETKTVAQIKIAIGPSPLPPSPVELKQENLLEYSLEEKTQTINFGKATECTGKVEHTATAQSFTEQFPKVAALIDPRSLRGLGACSRLVGMICPGSHSVFSRLQITLSLAHLNDPISYKVVETDDRFLLVRQEIEGCGIRGQLEAFAPPPPPKQTDCKTIASRLQKGEFDSQRALVIGGSRGLGELTAKIIATGGGDTLLTYASGSEDATNVVREISAAGGKAATIHFDIENNNDLFFKKIAEYKPTHLYYFATCRIAKQKNAEFEPDKFATFMKYYVVAFANLCRTISQVLGKDKLRVYYPSSIYVADRPPNMTEYAMAKAAGEILCADMQQILQNVTVHVQRLPKLLTDQTNVVTQQDLPDPVTILLPTLRLMQ